MRPLQPILQELVPLATRGWKGVPGVMRPAQTPRRMLKTQRVERVLGTLQDHHWEPGGTWRLPGKRTDVPVPCHRQGGEEGEPGQSYRCV